MLPRLLIPLLYFSPLSEDTDIVILQSDTSWGQPHDSFLPFSDILYSYDRTRSNPQVLVSSPDANRHLVSDPSSHLSTSTTLVLRYPKSTWISSLFQGPMTLLGYPPVSQSRQKVSWDFLLESGASQWRFLVRPGFQSDVPTSPRTRLRSILKTYGAYYFLPRERVTISAPTTGLSPIERAIRDVNLGPCPSKFYHNITLIYISSGDSLLCRVGTGDNIYFFRFPLSATALTRVDRGHLLTSRVRRLGSKLAPRPIAAQLHLPSPYACEAAAAGLPITGDPEPSDVRAALKAIETIHQLPSSRVEKMDDSLFERLIESRLTVIAHRAGRKRTQRLGRDLRSGLLDRAIHIGLTHGDFKVGNCLYSEGRVTGIVDWDLGSPEDLTILDNINALSSLIAEDNLHDTARATTALERVLPLAESSRTYHKMDPHIALLLWHIDRTYKHIHFGASASSWLSKHFKY